MTYAVKICGKAHPHCGVCAPDVHRRIRDGFLSNTTSEERSDRARKMGLSNLRSIESLTYGGVHKRLRLQANQPTTCATCGEEKKLDWTFAGEGHQRGAWSSVLSDYIALCRSCHLVFDREEVTS